MNRRINKSIEMRIKSPAGNKNLVPENFPLVIPGHNSKELKDTLNALYEGSGYSVIILKNDRRIVIIGCKRSGNVPVSNGPHSTSMRCNCPFKLKFYKHPDKTFRLLEYPLKYHNHPPQHANLGPAPFIEMNRDSFLKDSSALFRSYNGSKQQNFTGPLQVAPGCFGTANGITQQQIYGGSVNLNCSSSSPQSNFTFNTNASQISSAGHIALTQKSEPLIGSATTAASYPPTQDSTSTHLQHLPLPPHQQQYINEGGQRASGPIEFHTFGQSVYRVGVGSSAHVAHAHHRPLATSGLQQGQMNAHSAQQVVYPSQSTQGLSHTDVSVSYSSASAVPVSYPMASQAQAQTGAPPAAYPGHRSFAAGQGPPPQLQAGNVSYPTGQVVYPYVSQGQQQIQQQVQQGQGPVMMHHNCTYLPQQNHHQQLHQQQLQQQPHLGQSQSQHHTTQFVELSYANTPLQQLPLYQHQHQHHQHTYQQHPHSTHATHGTHTHHPAPSHPMFLSAASAPAQVAAATTPAPSATVSHGYQHPTVVQQAAPLPSTLPQQQQQQGGGGGGGGTFYPNHYLQPDGTFQRGTTSTTGFSLPSGAGPAVGLQGYAPSTSTLDPHHLHYHNQHHQQLQQQQHQHQPFQHQHQHQHQPYQTQPSYRDQQQAKLEQPRSESDTSNGGNTTAELASNSSSSNRSNSSSSSSSSSANENENENESGSSGHCSEFSSESNTGSSHGSSGGSSGSNSACGSGDDRDEEGERDGDEEGEEDEEDDGSVTPTQMPTPTKATTSSVLNDKKRKRSPLANPEPAKKMAV